MRNQSNRSGNLAFCNGGLTNQLRLLLWLRHFPSLITNDQDLKKKKGSQSPGFMFSEHTDNIVTHYHHKFCSTSHIQPQRHTMELKYTEAHHSYVFLSEAFTLANAANTKMVSAFVIMDPYAWALKSKYYAGRHPTSRFFFLLFFFFPLRRVRSVLSRANPKRKHELNGVPSLIWRGAKPLAHSHKGA